MAATARVGTKRAEKAPRKVRKPKYVKPAAPPVDFKKRGEHPCQFCNKVFSTEKIMLRHLCEQRRRYQQKDTLHARYGFHAFNEITKNIYGNSVPPKTEEEFRRSSYYLACLRWGRFLIDVHCWNPQGYLTWLLKLNVPIDKWNLDAVYDCWIQYWVFVEDPWDSSNRSIETMVNWASEVNADYWDYFRSSGGARVYDDVKKGLISGWIVFNSVSGQEWLGTLSPGDLEAIWPWIDAARWKVQFDCKRDIVEQMKEICNTAGL